MSSECFSYLVKWKPCWYLGSGLSKRKQGLSDYLFSGFPDTYNAAATCKYTLSKFSSDVCRIRLDFVDASLASPSTAGACTTDYFTGTQVSALEKLSWKSDYLKCEFIARWLEITSLQSVDITPASTSTWTQGPTGYLDYFLKALIKNSSEYLVP